MSAIHHLSSTLLLPPFLPSAWLRLANMPAREPADHDPLDAILRPPLDETPEEKACRIAQEEEARRVSMEIDESIRLERIARKKMRVVRLLLLGQSESGA